MTKEEALKLLVILSYIESYVLSKGAGMPEYIQEHFSEAIPMLLKIILGKGK